MNREQLITFLIGNGCVEERTDKKGYSVVRNVVNLKISGVPADYELNDALVCRICKTLEIAHPDEVAAAAALVDAVHRKFSKDGESE